MRLEARSPSCFSGRYVLKLDRRPHGEFRGRFFSEAIDVRFTGRRRLVFSSAGFWKGRFQLREAGSGEVLAGAQREGWLSNAWTLLLQVGSARLTSAGIFNSAYLVHVGGSRRAIVDRVGWCEGGWAVEGDELLTDVDLVFVGLIYHTILQRNQAAAGAATT